MLQSSISGLGIGQTGVPDLDCVWIPRILELATFPPCPTTYCGHELAWSEARGSITAPKQFLAGAPRVQ